MVSIARLEEDRPPLYAADVGRGRAYPTRAQARAYEAGWATPPGAPLEVDELTPAEEEAYRDGYFDREACDDEV